MTLRLYCKNCGYTCTVCCPDDYEDFELIDARTCSWCGREMEDAAEIADGITRILVPAKCKNCLFVKCCTWWVNGRDEDKCNNLVTKEEYLQGGKDGL